MTHVHPLAFGRRADPRAARTAPRDVVLPAFRGAGYVVFAAATAFHGGLDLILGSLVFSTVLGIVGGASR